MVTYEKRSFFNRVAFSGGKRQARNRSDITATIIKTNTIVRCFKLLTDVSVV